MADFLVHGILMLCDAELIQEVLCDTSYYKAQPRFVKNFNSIIVNNSLFFIRWILNGVNIDGLYNHLFKLTLLNEAITRSATRQNCPPYKIQEKVHQNIGLQQGELKQFNLEYLSSAAL